MCNNREENAAELQRQEEDLTEKFGSYEEWRSKFPEPFVFILHNTSETIEEAFEGSMSLVTEMKPSIVDEAEKTIWFDTVRFNLDSLSKGTAVDFVYRLACDTLDVMDDSEGHCNVEAWWD